MLTYRDVKYIGEGLLSIPDSLEHRGIPGRKESLGRKTVSIIHAHRVYRDKPQYNLPQWWIESVEQSKEVSSTGQTTIIRIPGENNYMVCGPYRESIYGWLSTLESSSVYYRREDNCTVVNNPTWGEDTNRRMVYYGLQSTSIAARDISPDTEEGRRLRKWSKEARDKGFEIPSRTLFPTKLTLLPHQEVAVMSLAYNNGGLLADDVGSGKSAMFIGGFLSQVQYKKRKLGVKNKSDLWPLVIITKKSLAKNTVEECKGWYKNARVELLQGRKRKAIPSDTQFIVCPISVLEGRLHDILKLNPQGVVCDESHIIKSPTTKQTKAALKLSRHVRKNSHLPYTVCASATPMPNRPVELWTQLEFCGMGDKIISYAETKQRFPEKVTIKVKKGRDDYYMKIDTPQSRKFEMRYCYDPRGGSYSNKGSSNEEELNSVMKDNGYIRRKKSEFITPLPLLHQNFINCKVNDEYMNRYRIAEEEFDKHLINTVKEKALKEGWSQEECNKEVRDKLRKMTKSEIIMKMTATRQIVGEAKIDSCIQWINRFFDKDPLIVGNDESRNKLIVFAHHKEVQRRIAEHPDLKKYGVMSISADNSKEIPDIVRKFQSKTSGKNLVICYSEAREGLTLTAAKDVLVTEMPFVPSWLIQMGGRCWARLSKDYDPHEAYLHYAVTDLGVDEYLMDMIRNKTHLQKKIIDGEYAMDVINQSDSEIE